MPPSSSPPLLVTDFLRDHWRMPRVDDDPPAWRYEGWLLWYVQEIQRTHPAIPDRWGYLERTIERKAFLDEPIPEIDFTNEGSQHLGNAESNLTQTLGVLNTSHGGWSGFMRFVEWLGYALGTSDTYPESVSDADSEKMYRLLNIGYWLLVPHDYLGRYLASARAGSKWNPNAFYPTPHCVCEMMSRMLASDLEVRMGETGVKDMRAMSVCDPCIGTGRFLLHASNFSMNLSGMDIDPLVLSISKINGAIYAPWMLIPPRQAIADADWRYDADTRALSGLD